MKRLVLVALAAMIGLSGCATLNKVNPFGESQVKKQKREQGILPDEDRRVSVLVFEHSLKVNPAETPAAIILPPSYQNSDWAQTGGYPSHAPQHLSGAADMKVVWKERFGRGSNTKGWLDSEPVIAGNQMFLMDGGGVVHAVNLTTHKEMWSRRLARKFVPAPKQDRPGRFSGGFRGVFDKMSSRRGEGYGGGLAVSGGKLFVASGYRTVAALDVKTGDPLWETNTPTPMHNAPAVDGARVYAVSQDDELMAFNTQTGEIEWTFQGIVEPARILTTSAPAIYGEFVVAPFASGELGAFRAQNGRTIWSDALTRSAGLTALSELNDVAASPVVYDNVVYAISHSGLLAATDLRSGQRLWSLQVGGIHMPWVAGSTIFIVSNEGQVAAVNRADGKVVWVKQLRDFKNEKKKKKRIAWAGPVLVSDRLVLVSSHGDLVTMSPQTGETINEQKLPGEFFIAPIVAKGVMYLVSNEGHVFALK